MARLPPSVSVSRNGGKLDSSRHGMEEEDVDVDCDESSESNGARSSVLQAWLIRLPRLSNAGELHRWGIEVPPRFLS